VEHLIGESQGGEYREILLALQRKFSGVPRRELEEHAEQLERENMVTACAFCNSTTSRDKHSTTMEDLIADAGTTWEEVLSALQAEAKKILNRKRADVAWKLASIREHFEHELLPKLRRSRQRRLAT